ncbi:hypothetical protein K438DRAFT_2176980 [Mycena galopus ATCC 62051]|nr:hypothetical protein K438DRAFT_2176980 [Mycena galopus ATCC 62051]
MLPAHSRWASYTRPSTMTAPRIRIAPRRTGNNSLKLAVRTTPTRRQRAPTGLSERNVPSDAVHNELWRFFITQPDDGEGTAGGSSCDGMAPDGCDVRQRRGHRKRLAWQRTAASAGAASRSPTTARASRAVAAAPTLAVAAAPTPAVAAAPTPAVAAAPTPAVAAALTPAAAASTMWQQTASDDGERTPGNSSTHAHNSSSEGVAVNSGERGRIGGCFCMQPVDGEGEGTPGGSSSTHTSDGISDGVAVDGDERGCFCTHPDDGEGTLGSSSSTHASASGMLSIFLIPRSRCVFVNYNTEPELQVHDACPWYAACDGRMLISVQESGGNAAFGGAQWRRSMITA